MPSLCFFINVTVTTKIYTLSLHDALPICDAQESGEHNISALHGSSQQPAKDQPPRTSRNCTDRSEEHTSELQSHSDIVCRLLLEKKNRRMAEIFRRVTRRISMPY